MATEISSQELGMVLYRADTFRARISDFWKTRNRVRVGGEPLPALFASLGAQIVATDQSPETGMDAGWASSCLSGLNQQDICPEHTFSRLVTFREVNMNDIDADLSGQFDFCWSSCALEHLGSLQHGLDFIENSLAILKPGGIAIHTTEFNLSSISLSG